MRPRWTKASLAAAAAGALVLGGLAATTGWAEPNRTTAEPDWGDCPEPTAPSADSPRARDLECATIDVPLDYDEPDGDTIEIAVSRLPSTDATRRRGALLLNPGGPGAPGLDMPLHLAELGLPESVMDSYDLIGFDPRGVGTSSPVSCGWSEQDEALAMPTHPGDGGDVAARKKVVDDLGAKCAASKDRDVLPHINTPNTARDLDRIRAALGEDEISYYGTSYGTYLGAVWAQLYPDTTDRVILDSSVNPKDVWRDAFRSWGAGAELRFPDFANWAAAEDATYHLGDTPAEVEDTWFRLADKVDTEPVGPVDGTVYRQYSRAMLYYDQLMPQLARFLHGVDTGEVVLPDPGESGVELPDVTAMSVVTCNDAAFPHKVSTYRHDVRKDRKRYPMVGAMTANMWVCAGWTLGQAEPKVAITDDGPSNILLLQTLRDPATPLAGAMELRETLGDRARMVTVDSGSHGVYLYAGNRCGDDAATRFLVDGERPRHDRHCGAEA